MEVGFQPEAKPLVCVCARVYMCVCVCVCVCVWVGRGGMSEGRGGGGRAEWTRRLAQHSLCHQSFLFSEEHF